MKIAICYDWLDSQGGAERLLSTILEIFPDADLFTLVRSKELHTDRTGKVYASLVNQFPFPIKSRWGLALAGWWLWGRFDFAKYDLVIAVTGNCGHAIKARRVLFVCLSPARYLWHKSNGFLDPIEYGFAAYVLWIVAPVLRLVDFYSARRVDRIVAISMTVKSRVQRYYGKESVVVYPGV